LYSTLPTESSGVIVIPQTGSTTSVAGVVT
jgi:hypothetical protein